MLFPDGEGYRLNGTKYYTTGTVFAEWADVYVRRELEDDFAIAIVDTREPGVTVSDDWDGFGQRGTGSGTATFIDVAVDRRPTCCRSGGGSRTRPRSTS